MKKTASLLATGIIAATMVGATPGTAGAAVGDYCSPESGFQSQTTITNHSRTAVVTHGVQKTLAPGGTWSTTVSLSKVDQVTAGVTVSTGASVSADAILTKAEASLSIDVQMSGSTTTTTSISETVSQHNGTGLNRHYVAFAGTTKHSGNFSKTYCNLSIRRVEASTGAWRSWNVQSTGNTLRCDLAVYSELAKEAKRRFCG